MIPAISNSIVDLLRPVSALLALLVLNACATTAGAPGAGDLHTDPPVMLAGQRSPQLQFTGVTGSGRDPVRIRIEVDVDSSGRPKMETLRVTGRGAVENRRAIEQWISQATFRPAMRNGEPVEGVYRTEIAARIRRRG